MLLKNVFGDILAENQGVWVRAVDAFHVAMADVLSITYDFDAAHGISDGGEFVTHSHSVEDFLGADVQDECFGDILCASCFVDDAAGNAIAGHFRSER